jgi:hypothetical protein
MFKGRKRRAGKLNRVGRLLSHSTSGWNADSASSVSPARKALDQLYVLMRHGPGYPEAVSDLVPEARTRR